MSSSSDVAAIATIYPTPLTMLFISLFPTRCASLHEEKLEGDEETCTWYCEQRERERERGGGGGGEEEGERSAADIL